MFAAKLKSCFSLASKLLNGSLDVIWHCAVGYKSRADENIWNGSSRKILDNECAMKKMMLQSIPHMVSKCEKLGVTALSSLIWFFSRCLNFTDCLRLDIC
jgi:hypothetical protein